MKLIADNNTNITNQLEFLESLVKKYIPANKNGCRALSIDFVGRAALEIQILYTWDRVVSKRWSAAVIFSVAFKMSEIFEFKKRVVSCSDEDGNCIQVQGHETAYKLMKLHTSS